MTRCHPTQHSPCSAGSERKEKSCTCSVWRTLAPEETLPGATSFVLPNCKSEAFEKTASVAVLWHEECHTWIGFFLGLSCTLTLFAFCAWAVASRAGADCLNTGVSSACANSLELCSLWWFAPGQHSQGFIAMWFLTWKETVRVKISISQWFRFHIVPWSWFLHSLRHWRCWKSYSTATSLADPGNRLGKNYVLHLPKHSLCHSKPCRLFSSPSIFLLPLPIAHLCPAFTSTSAHWAHLHLLSFSNE